MFSGSLIRAPGIASCAAVASAFPKSVSELTAFAGRATETAKAAIADIERDGTSYLEQQAPAPFQLARTLDLAATDFGASVGIVSVVKNVAVDKALRDKATEVLVELQNTSIDLFSSNRKVHRLLKAVAPPSVPKDAKADSVPAQRAYWLEDKVAEYERDGHGLDDASFAEVVALKKELAALSTKFMTNVSEDKTTLLFTTEELEGVPESIVKALKLAKDVPELPAESLSTKGGDAHVVRLDYPTYFGIMKNCRVANTRATLGRAFVQRAFPANESVLAKVVELRTKLAQLVGFKTYAELDLASKMAKTPATAQAFIENLVPGLQKKWEKESNLLKADLPDSVTLDSEGRFSIYDIAFVMNDYKRKRLNVDETEIQNYFPTENTITVLFSIYEKFFDVTFTHHKDGLELWHKDVSVIEVRDNRRNSELLGFIALDLFPREGKYSHACCHAAVPAVLQDSEESGPASFTPALSVVIANFPAATHDRPSLLLHGDAETFFHEFGHAMHGMFGRSAMGTHAGTRVKRDFVELPSQILEEWLWDAEILEKVTKHHKTGETLPAELRRQKIESKMAFSGHDSLRQLQFATLSLQLFGNTLERSADDFFVHGIQPKIMPGVAYDDQSRFTSSFGHLMGYAATYYGYMWSEVFAVDVFETIQRENGLLNGETGRRYSASILEVGGGRDPAEMLKDFLGRPASNEAFLRKLGIEA